MYTIHLQTGEVIRDFDGVVVAPCQSTDEPNYVEYVNWIISGNQPSVVEVEPVALEEVVVVVEE